MTNSQDSVSLPCKLQTNNKSYNILGLGLMVSISSLPAVFLATVIPPPHLPLPPPSLSNQARFYTLLTEILKYYKFRPPLFPSNQARF